MIAILFYVKACTEANIIKLVVCSWLVLFGRCKLLELEVWGYWELVNGRSLTTNNQQLPKTKKYQRQKITNDYKYQLHSANFYLFFCYFLK
ncbi:hypothetical protein BpHYR1_002135 [Brachionus plicatilis]|uniref:Uncharacterized protein n=1 Tax=Brachionus plicatilis TaxID=10195 RepID=A0A3M7RX77_BRAPC|nr:hypothetical protein BpHYR1_002135 [Brachionus plicatilis]